MKNVPYVKKYDPKTGKLLNPIKFAYMNPHPNRGARRLFTNKKK